MRRQVHPLPWSQRTIKLALSLFELRKLTRSEGLAELRSPAELCPRCHRRSEVIVHPDGICGSCWSKRLIAGWKIPPRIPG
jgi:hypothetical protein